MHRTRLALPSSASLILVGVLASGCATATPSAQDGLRLEPDVARFTATEQRERADSARAQMVADEVGPRVRVMADFDYAGGSRQVSASFHMYDDAYVVVGHMDAAGRLKIVFPSSPGDDGFVRGDKIYHVPEFFAGFADEYAWRHSDYRYRYHSAASRYDSYDAGLGYVFVIASWRPMRLDRIADGNRWQTYDVSDINYMQDPREAIEELGSVIAGDNREAYTIEYAHYTTTNYGTYSLSSFDAANGGCAESRLFPSLFYSPFAFSPFGYATSYYGAYGCPSYGSYWYGFGAGYYTPVTVGLNGPPRVHPGVAAPPIGFPIFHRPQGGAWPLHKPGSSGAIAAPKGAITTVNGGTTYHRPGLITEDAGPPRGLAHAHEPNTPVRGFADRPNIQDMIGGRRLDDGTRNTGMRSNTGVTSHEPSWTSRGGANSRPRDDGGVYRSQGGRTLEGPRTTPTHATPSYSSPRSHPSPSYTPRSAPRSEPSHSAPARAEPAARSAPAPSSSSSGSKKP
jgi:hypothetical protein